jgi:hypothetical protein
MEIHRLLQQTELCDKIFTLVYWFLCEKLCQHCIDSREQVTTDIAMYQKQRNCSYSRENQKLRKEAVLWKGWIWTLKWMYPVSRVSQLFIPSSEAIPNVFGSQKYRFQQQ